MPQTTFNAQYESWTCSRTRTSRNGLAVMPTAGPWPQDAQVVVLDGGLEVETTGGMAIMTGAVPVIVSPNSLTNNANRLYLGGSQTGALPVVSFGGIKVYAVAWSYAWCILSPEGLDGNFCLGVSPLDPDPANVEYVQSYKMVATLLNDNSGLSPPLDGQYENLPRVIIQIEDER